MKLRMIALCAALSAAQFATNPPAALANASLGKFSCENPEMLGAANRAYSEHEKRIAAIPGVTHVEVGDCSSMESPAVRSESEFVCGVFLYFSDDFAQQVFSETSKLWGGLVLNKARQAVPVCSRVVARPIR
ncbi:MAG: hypothetical protein NDJ89_08560 [Oligoflexia bacterium]|nr:hypothetical protein [Oligoflexia bacterium]